MGRKAIHDWEELLKEYLKSEYLNKSEFAKAKGINPSLLRRNTTNWPNKSRGETEPKIQNQPEEKVIKKNKSNVTKKESNGKLKNDKSNKSNVTKKVKEKVAKKAKSTKSKIKDYLVTVQPKSKPEECTEKEKLFCQYFIRNFNATQSYFKAFEGCTYNTAHAEGYKLLAKPCVRAEVNRLKRQRQKALMAKAEDIVEKHMRIAFSDITDYVEFGRMEVPVMGAFGPVMLIQKVINGTTGQEEERSFPVTKIINDVRFKESVEIDGTIISEVKVGRDGASIKLLDPQKSLEWLDRYFEMNPMDRHKKEYDLKRLKLQEQEIGIKSKTGSAIQEAIVNAQVQVQTLAKLLNGAKTNRKLESFENND